MASIYKTRRCKLTNTIAECNFVVLASIGETSPYYNAPNLNIVDQRTPGPEITLLFPYVTQLNATQSYIILKYILKGPLAKRTGLNSIEKYTLYGLCAISISTLDKLPKPKNNSSHPYIA